jgi:hypothetical protein
VSYDDFVSNLPLVHLWAHPLHNSLSEFAASPPADRHLGSIRERRCVQLQGFLQAESVPEPGEIVRRGGYDGLRVGSVDPEGFQGEELHSAARPFLLSLRGYDETQAQRVG